MWVIRLIAVVAVFLSGHMLRCQAGLPGQKAKNWSFTPLFVKSKSSDEGKFKCELDLQRIKGREMGLGGSCIINYDVNVPTMQVEGKSFRSDTGKEDDYKPLPFVMKKSGAEEFFNGLYKDLLMASVDGCSNLPVFKDKFTPPLKQDTYTLDKCKINIENMPDHMRPGYYKIILIGSGEVDWDIEVGVKIDEEDD